MKKYLMAIMALALAVGFTAFKAQSVKHGDIKFFRLIDQGDETDASAKTTASSWQLSGTGGAGISCDAEPDHLCQIEAEEDDNNPGKPVLTPTLQGYLNTSSVPAARPSNPRIDTYSGDE